MQSPLIYPWPKFSGNDQESTDGNVDVCNIEKGKWPENNEVRHNAVSEPIDDISSPPSNDETDADAAKRM